MERANELVDAAMGTADPTICYCYRKTLSNLVAVYRELGSLEELQKATGVGLGCGGCRLTLRHIFGEVGQDINKIVDEERAGSSCLKPGTLEQCGFLVADSGLESKVVICNGVAPQLGVCDATTAAEVEVYDCRGYPIYSRNITLSTNETFNLKTTEIPIVRPFCGLVRVLYNRSNQGASRFNIHWYNENSVASTHENATPGRPRVFLSSPINKASVHSGTQVYLGIINPHRRAIGFTITAFDHFTKKSLGWDVRLDGLASTWVNATNSFYKPLSELCSEGRYVLKVETLQVHYLYSPAVYFFFHNSKRDLWSAQHL